MISTPSSPRGSSAGPRTLRSKDRGEIAEALLGHLQDEEAVRELLDFAELHGDGQIARAKVTFDGDSWTADLFGPRKEAA